MSVDPAALSPAERRELAPDGILPVAIAVGGAVSAVWARRADRAGEFEGVTVELARAIAARYGLALRLVAFGSSGQIVDQAEDGAWTLAFVPIDEERRRRLLVGPAYHAGVSTYLVRQGAGLAHVEDVDRAGVRVAGIAGTATLRSAVRTLRHTSAQATETMEAAMDRFARGELDAVALGRDSILSLIRTIPGAAIAAGHFHKAETALVVPRGRPHALAAASRVMDGLLADGTVAAALRKFGIAP
jgi:polar amino acid transport system substrate-binding protein